MHEAMGQLSCPSCGRSNRNAKFCDRCGKPLTSAAAANPYAAPVDGLDAQPGTAEGPPLAGRAARLGAALIDGFCVALVGLPLSFAVDLTPRTSWTDTAIAAALGFVVFLLLQVWTLAEGRTIGKRALGLRMVDVDTGRPPPPSRLIAWRYAPLSALALLGPLGSLVSIVDVLLVFRSDRRCLHDLVARTRVVYDPDRDE